uniref:DUF4605 domain-containing protein n=1 Tax=Arion vulgaris TaxID=1028688 RepID=A0A0B7AFY7_9EUPU
MVRILPNGDIVADDDPRVQQTTRRPDASTHPGQRRFQTTRNAEPGPGYEPQVNIFQSLNQRLIAFGIPRFNVGDIAVEPIVTIGMLIALLVFGIHGLILGIILFAVSRWSTHGAPGIVSRFFGGGQEGGDNNGRDNRHQGRAGGGYRLGR